MGIHFVTLGGLLEYGCVCWGYLWTKICWVTRVLLWWL